MEEKILVNVLRQINKGASPTAAPDSNYVRALETIGMIKLGWDTTLTEFGRKTLERFNSQENW